MIFELTPYVRLTVLILLFFIDYALTNYIINTVWKDRWRREAPDLLDAIRTPEPAYIPEESVPQNRQSDAAESKQEVRKFRRRQHEALKDSDKNELAVIKTAASSSEANTVQQKQKVKSVRTPVNEAESIEKVSVLEKPKAASSGWMNSLEDMDTVEFEDAVMQLEERIAGAKTSESRIIQEHSDKQAEDTAESEPASAVKAEEPESSYAEEMGIHSAKQEVKPDSWMSPLDEMETMSLTDAVRKAAGVDEMPQNRRAGSGKKRRKKQKKQK